VEGNRNGHRFWLETFKESDHLEEVNLDEKAVCRKLAGSWAAFSRIYCSTGTRVGAYERGGKPYDRGGCST
jgi:hypothetical protein